MMDIDDDLIPDGVPDDAPDVPKDADMHVLDVADTGPMDAVGEPIEPDDPPDDAGQVGDEPLALDETSSLGAAGETDIFASQDQASNIWGGMEEEVPLAPMEDTFDLLGATYSDFDFAGYDDLVETHGTPDYEMQFWDKQDEDYSCVPATTNMIFHSLNIPTDEGDLTKYFEDRDVYDPMTGSNPDKAVDAINDFFADNDLNNQAMSYRGLDLKGLESLLDQGLKIQATVDYAELHVDWLTRALNDLGLIDDSPHSVMPIGIEHTPNGSFVVINDPGVPDGAGQRIPADAFMDAWADRGYSGFVVGDNTVMASLQSEPAMTDSEMQVGGVGGLEQVTVDVFGRLHKGNNPFPMNMNGPAWWGPGGFQKS